MSDKEWTIINVDAGDKVICDWCNKDWTDSDVSGGFLFGTYATCPDCAEEKMESIKKYKEEWHIKGHCPENVSFSNWIKGMR